ncbi:hypothetical protein E3N88_40868 [Mikania micrantha]|uniref:Uncharacterized protein n=1 Tax=Mikania micrantha TaxID=192012 RepID=A0A5N6LPU1_9ASTR|nr:hypothetical protein E3N88_40868 [Mikania micrantha]
MDKAAPADELRRRRRNGRRALLRPTKETESLKTLGMAHGTRLDFGSIPSVGWSWTLDGSINCFDDGSISTWMEFQKMNVHRTHGNYLRMLQMAEMMSSIAHGASGQSRLCSNKVGMRVLEL